MSEYCSWEECPHWSFICSLMPGFSWYWGVHIVFRSGWCNLKEIGEHPLISVIGLWRDQCWHLEALSCEVSVTHLQPLVLEKHSCSGCWCHLDSRHWNGAHLHSKNYDGAFIWPCTAYFSLPVLMVKVLYHSLFHIFIFSPKLSTKNCLDVQKTVYVFIASGENAGF